MWQKEVFSSNAFLSEGEVPGGHHIIASLWFIRNTLPVFGNLFLLFFVQIAIRAFECLYGGP